MSKLVWLSRVGLAVMATVSVASLTASPAQAGTTGVVWVTSAFETEVHYNAGKGKQNRVVVTRSGKTVTVDDRVAIKAGKGCKPVKGDRTRVRCTTAQKPVVVAVNLYDRNDSVVNRTSLSMAAFGGSGNDRIIGGPVSDHLDGGSGRDELHGLGNDRTTQETLFGGPGNDVLHGGSGGDWIAGDAGNDIAYGGSGYDDVFGNGGRDRLYGGGGNDHLSGYDGKGANAGDRLYGGANLNGLGDHCETFKGDVKSGCER